MAVFAQGDNAEKATAAGADLVGFEDLGEQIKAGNMDFDVVIATPDAMRIVGQLGKVLGPRGLMPNPKTGTVTADVETAVKNAKAGQVQFRTDKAGIVHGSIGQVGFDDIAQIKENLEALVGDLKKRKPSLGERCVFKEDDPIDNYGSRNFHRPRFIRNLRSDVWILEVLLFALTGAVKNRRCSSSLNQA